MAPVFEELIMNLQGLGFFRYFMPFLLMMAVTYGILQRAELFEDETVDGVVAAVVSFMSIVGIYTFVGGAFFTQFFGVVTIAIFVLIGYVIILGTMGVDVTEVANLDDAQKKRTAWYGGGVLALVGLLFMHYLDIVDGGQLLGSDEFLTFLVILGMYIVISKITSGD